MKEVTPTVKISLSDYQHLTGIKRDWYKRHPIANLKISSFHYNNDLEFYSEVEVKQYVQDLIQNNNNDILKIKEVNALLKDKIRTLENRTLLQRIINKPVEIILDSPAKNAY